MFFTGWEARLFKHMVDKQLKLRQKPRFFHVTDVFILDTSVKR